MARVALVTHELTGGVGTMTRFLHRILLESGRYEPHVVLLATSSADHASLLALNPRTWKRGAQVRRSTDRGLTYDHVGAWIAELEFQRYRSRSILTNILADFDIVQFIAGSAPWVAAARHVAKPTFLWVATTIAADTDSRRRMESLPRRVWTNAMNAVSKRYENRALETTKHIFALSPYTRSSILAMNPSAQVSVAMCGVDVDLFRPLNSDEPLRSDAGYIICVARLSDARKNVGMLLRAYSKIVAENPNVPDLCLVGESLSEDGRRLLEKLGITAKVRTPGLRYGEALAELYRHASFFVLPSDEEGLAIVILEAMASGIPVVSTASGGPNFIVSEGETGFLTPVGDEAALTSAMMRLLSDDALRRRLGTAARNVAETQFSLRATSKPFLEEYDRALRV